MSIGRIRIGRPSPAMMVAIIALFVALGGSGYAALSGKDKKKVRGIADQEIAAKAGGLAVATAANATNATNATNAGTAANANALGGTAATGFAQSFTGRADSANSAVDTVFSVDSMGVAIRDAGFATDSSTFKVTNTRQVGGGNVNVDFASNDDVNTPAAVAPTNSSVNIPKTGNPAFVTDPAAPGRVLVVWCQLGVAAKITCFGLLKG
jgi:hypothetical protein